MQVWPRGWPVDTRQHLHQRQPASVASGARCAAFGYTPDDDAGQIPGNLPPCIGSGNSYRPPLHLRTALVASTPTSFKGFARFYQLVVQLENGNPGEYTFRRASMGKYENFDVCSRQALSSLSKSLRIGLSARDQETLIEGYQHLHTYPDAVPGLRKLKDAG